MIIRVLAIFAICFIVFNFIFKVLFSLFNASNSGNFKKTGAKKTNINITRDSQATNKSKTGEYIDFEEVK